MDARDPQPSSAGRCAPRFRLYAFLVTTLAVFYAGMVAASIAEGRFPYLDRAADQQRQAEQRLQHAWRVALAAEAQQRWQEAEGRETRAWRQLDEFLEHRLQQLGIDLAALEASLQAAPLAAAPPVAAELPERLPDEGMAGDLLRLREQRDQLLQRKQHLLNEMTDAHPRVRALDAELLRVVSQIFELAELTEAAEAATVPPSEQAGGPLVARPDGADAAGQYHGEHFVSQSATPLPKLERLLSDANDWLGEYRRARERWFEARQARIEAGAGLTSAIEPPARPSPARSAARQRASILHSQWALEWLAASIVCGALVGAGTGLLAWPSAPSGGRPPLAAVRRPSPARLGKLAALAAVRLSEWTLLLLALALLLLTATAVTSG